MATRGPLLGCLRDPDPHLPHLRDHRGHHVDRAAREHVREVHRATRTAAASTSSAPLHGYAFLAYVLVVFLVRAEYGWSNRMTAARARLVRAAARDRPVRALGLPPPPALAQRARAVSPSFGGLGLAAGADTPEVGPGAVARTAETKEEGCSRSSHESRRPWAWRSSHSCSRWAGRRSPRAPRRRLGKLISGSKIKRGSIPGNRLVKGGVTGDRIKSNSITGKQINESTLGTVPSATTAKQVTLATARRTRSARRTPTTRSRSAARRRPATSASRPAPFRRASP